MEINKAKPGDFCWFELGTTDQPAAKKFYEDLFGWKANDVPMGPDAFYTMFQLRGKTVGAAYTLDPNQVQQGIPPHWGTYVAVKNVDDAIAKAQSLGATVIVEPMDVADHGRMGVISDPTGAVISMWQPMKHGGVELWGEVGAFCWCELMSRDIEAATKFYTSLFGWKTKLGNMPGMQYTHWQNDGADIGGMMAIQEAWGPMPAHWVNYIQVADCDEMCAQATSLGGKVCMPSTEIPNTGRFAMIQDPQGAMFSLFELQQG